MILYLDNCCFNRPFDDQSQLRIHLESEAKLQIQDKIHSGLYKLVWSYILDYENSRNPFAERREQISKWQSYADVDIVESEEVVSLVQSICRQAFKSFDALYLACAVIAGADYFLTTDDGILKRAELIADIKITDPIGFIKQVSS